MIRKIFIILAVLVFAFSVLFLSVFKAASAKTTNTIAPLKIVVPPSSLTPTPKLEIQYYLPYPGILPDHPLYPLKMIRDRIWLWLTTNLVKKAEVMLLYADKRLGAGKVLIEGNKINLGTTTLEKAEKYLEQATGQLEEAQKQGLEIKQQVEKLKTAALKHEEVVLGLSKSLSGEAKVVAGQLLVYPKNILLRVEKLLP